MNTSKPTSEKVIIDSTQIDKKEESNHDELSLSQELLENSEVENKPQDNMDLTISLEKDPNEDKEKNDEKEESNKNISQSKTSFPLQRFLTLIPPNS
jgi:hypothetical protein